MKYPYLSIVVSSRNDDHGGGMFKRMQTTLSSIVSQLETYKLESELVLVDYNPPADKPLLKDALKWPDKTKYCSIRTIVVPPAIHNRFKDSEKTSWHGVTAQNVGMRRARGRFILMTNIDILFSNELIELLSKKNLEDGKMYRNDRYDVPRFVLEIDSLDERLSFCRDNPIWIHTRYGTIPVVRKRRHFTGDSLGIANGNKFVSSNKWLIKELVQAQMLSAPVIGLFDKLKTLPNLHLNAPDFMMMSKELWHSLRGYPEIDTLGAVDPILNYMVNFSGGKEETLPASHCIYHIDHASVYTNATEPTLKERIIFSFFQDETAIKLNEVFSTVISKSPLAIFKKKSKLIDRGISYLNWQDVFRIICEMKEGKRPLILNDEGWGLGNENLDDYIVRKANWEE